MLLPAMNSNTRRDIRGGNIFFAEAIASPSWRDSKHMLHKTAELPPSSSTSTCIMTMLLFSTSFGVSGGDAFEVLGEEYILIDLY